MHYFLVQKLIWIQTPYGVTALTFNMFVSFFEANKIIWHKVSSCSDSLVDMNTENSSTTCPKSKNTLQMRERHLFIDSIEKYLCRKFVCLPPTYVYHQFLLVYLVAVACNRQNFAHVHHAHRPNFLYGRRIVKESKAHMEHVLFASKLSPIRAHNWMIHCCCFLLLFFTFVIYSTMQTGKGFGMWTLVARAPTHVRRKTALYFK